MKMHNTTTGVAITAGDSWENADFIVLNLTGDARVFYASEAPDSELMDMTEALGAWEDMGGTFEDWQSALTALDARR
jgi:hypothetical protein